MTVFQCISRTSFNQCTCIPNRHHHKAKVSISSWSDFIVLLDQYICYWVVSYINQRLNSIFVCVCSIFFKLRRQWFCGLLKYVSNNFPLFVLSMQVKSEMRLVERSLKCIRSKCAFPTLTRVDISFTAECSGVLCYSASLQNCVFSAKSYYFALYITIIQNEEWPEGMWRCSGS